MAKTSISLLNFVIIAVLESNFAFGFYLDQNEEESLEIFDDREGVIDELVPDPDQPIIVPLRKGNQLALTTIFVMGSAAMTVIYVLCIFIGNFKMNL